MPPSSVDLSPGSPGIIPIITQYAHPPSTMADLRQTESPIQREADDDSGPDTDQENTVIRDEPSDMELRQILKEQKVGKFDFDRDFGIIKNEDDFKQRLREWETMDDKPTEDDEPERRSDFPLDFEIQRHYVRRVGKAILNMDGATDKTIKDRKRTSKSQKPSTKYQADVPADEEPGEKNSVAVTFLSGLKSVEVELVSWKIVTFSRDAQEDRLSRGTYGSQKTKIMHFDSWTERIEFIIHCLETTKTIARSIIREGDLSMKDFVASPKTKMDTANRNRTINCQRAEEKDAANKAKGAALREEKRQSHSPIGTQNILATTGSPQDESTPNPLESSRTRHGRDGQVDVGSGSSTAEMQKEPSAIPRESPMGGRKTPSAASNNGFRGPLTSMGEGGKQPTGLLVPSLVKIPSQGGRLGAGDKGFLHVAQPGSDNCNTSTTTQNGPSTQNFPTPTDASRTTASDPTSINAGSNRTAAWSPSLDPILQRAIIKCRTRAKQQPGSSTSNEFTSESVINESPPPTLPSRPSSGDNTGPGQSSRGPTTRLSAVTSSPPSARKPLPSSARRPLPSSATQRPQTSGFPSFPGGASFQGGISGGPSIQPSAKKRPHSSSQLPEDYGPGNRSANATMTQKRQKRYPTKAGSDLNAYDIEQEEYDDDDEEEEEEE
ncbi:hypothetical protein INS49_003015 [Diaporthe citri]|uniref:uncharacterized protein n=1 Tax=Diaporthe citri TaxID=83186 RepID=UPI001C7FD6F9|nr:uncharacterized protein INS49_003015 [Diaporthe citri]KAG6368801.1 hypothetical protein INS49_003015 [Diaporthe citri]